jgi:hypothetical protein
MAWLAERTLGHFEIPHSTQEKSHADFFTHAASSPHMLCIVTVKAGGREMG